MAKSKKSIKKNGLVIFSVIAVLMVVAVFFCATVILATDNINAQKAYDQMLLSNSFVSRLLDNNIVILDKLGKQLYDISENNYMANSKLLNSYAEVNNFDYIVMADTNGEVIYGNQKSSIRQTKGFAACIEGETFITDAKISSFTGQNIITFCVPLQTQGTTQKILYGAKTVKQLHDELQACHFEQDSYTYILDSEGMIAFSYGDRAWKTGTNFAKNVMQVDGIKLTDATNITTDVKEHSTTVHSISTADGRMIVAVSPIQDYSRWTMVSSIKNGSIAGETGVLKLSVIFLVAIFVLCIFLWFGLRKTEHLRAAEIDTLSTTDQLTGIGNLNKFYTEAAEILKTAIVPYAILKIDISDFRQINDTLGYTIGDQILRIVAKNLSRKYSISETCARIISDHFVVLAKDKKDIAQECSEELKQSVIEVLGENIGQVIGFSIGKYKITNTAETVVEMIDKSNIALKTAKGTAGGSIVNFSDSLVTHIVAEKNLEKSMVKALETGEFKVYIQPKYKISNLKFMGAEALIRWENPTAGFLVPDSFIPLFERNGFIKEIDFFVLETVMQRLNYLHSVGFEYFQIAVNMSRVTILSQNYIQRISQLIEKYAIPAKYIELEITETVLAGNNKKLLELIYQIRELGCLIVMDDFGSGYSSLNMLKEVPFDVLKIDREFMNESKTSEKTRIILTSMIDMAKKINVQVVCEGIETKSHIKFLKELSCEVGQGFYFAKPMPFAQFEQELEDKRYDL